MSILLSHTFATAIFFSAVRCGLTLFFCLRVPSVAVWSQVSVGCWHEDIPVKRTSAFTLWPPGAALSLRRPPITVTFEQNHTILPVLSLLDIQRQHCPVSTIQYHNKCTPTAKKHLCSRPLHKQSESFNCTRASLCEMCSCAAWEHACRAYIVAMQRQASSVC